MQLSVLKLLAASAILTSINFASAGILQASKDISIPAHSYSLVSLTSPGSCMLSFSETTYDRIISMGQQFRYENISISAPRMLSIQELQQYLKIQFGKVVTDLTADMSLEQVKDFLKVKYNILYEGSPFYPILIELISTSSAAQLRINCFYQSAPSSETLLGDFARGSFLKPPQNL